MIQNSNYEEIVSNVDYLESLKVVLPDEPICQLLMCFIDYDDWVYFKKYFLIYFESKRVSENTIKKIISSLVEKQSIELLKYVVSVTIKDKGTFMNLKLSENQYKFIILGLVKSHMDIASKLATVTPSGDIKKNSSPELNKPDDLAQEKVESANLASQFEYIKSESSESDDFFEIIDEAMIDKIISDLAATEKGTLK